MNYKEIKRLYSDIQGAGGRVTVARVEYRTSDLGGRIAWLRDNVSGRVYFFNRYSPFIRSLPDFPQVNLANSNGVFEELDDWEPPADLVWGEVLAIHDQLEYRPRWGIDQFALTLDGGYQMVLYYKADPSINCDYPDHDLAPEQCACTHLVHIVHNYDEFERVRDVPQPIERVRE